LEALVRLANAKYKETGVV